MKAFAIVQDTQNTGDQDLSAYQTIENADYKLSLKSDTDHEHEIGNMKLLFENSLL